MKLGDLVSVQRMKAWWAYSEIRSPRLKTEYHVDSRVPPLSAKIEANPFDHLSTPDVATLAEISERFRGCVLNHYWAEVREFVLDSWTAAQLGQVYAMSELDASGQGRYLPFRDYAASLPSTGPDAWIDPRAAADKLPPATTLRTPDPLIVGLYRGHQVLIDGYFRGINFMRTASPGEHVSVLVPVPMGS